jgi:surface antigen
MIKAVASGMRVKSELIAKTSGEFFDLAIDTNKIIEAMGEDFSGKLPALLIGNLRDLEGKQKTIYETFNKYSKNLTMAADKYEAADEELAKSAALLGISTTIAGMTVGGELAEDYFKEYKWRYWTNKDGNWTDAFECTGYVRNRINILKGRKEGDPDYIDIPGNGGQWLKNAEDKGMSVGHEVRAGSIACFSGPTSYGHVIYVEEVKDGMVYFTEANVDGGVRDGQRSPSDGVLKCLSIKEFELLNGNSLQGYIYLDKASENT